MNTARKGRRYEWKIRDQYIEKGYIVTRSASSKGKIDLIAIHPQLKIIALIQCKAGKLSNPEKERILSHLKQFEGQYTVIGALH